MITAEAGNTSKSECHTAVSFLGLVSMAVGIVAAVGPVFAADSFPNRPLRILVGFAPGAGADSVSRVVAEKLTGVLREQIIVENRPGASGNIAAEIVSHATPDGYTMLMGTIAVLAVNVSLNKKLSFDPVKDFAPVALTVTQTNVLVVHPSVPAKSVKDLIVLARSKPRGLTFASSGIGTTTHLSAILFNDMAGLDMVHVAYKGGGPATLGLLRGEVELLFAPAPSALPHIRAGKLRALAVTTAKRWPVLPAMPTVAEVGLQGYETYGWYGIVAPANTPRPIIERLNKEIVSVLSMPDVKEKLFRQGLDVVTPMTPAQFGAYIKAEIVKWANVIKSPRAQ